MRASIASNLPKTLRKRIIKHYLSTPSEHPLFKELAEMGVEAFDRSATTPQTLPQSHDLSEEEAKIENLASGATSNEDQLPPLITRFWLAVVQQDNFKEVLMELIATTVKKPAEIQSLKGLFTAGVTRSIRYLLSKFSKVRCMTDPVPRRAKVGVAKIRPNFHSGAQLVIAWRGKSTTKALALWYKSG